MNYSIAILIVILRLNCRSFAMHSDDTCGGTLSPEKFTRLSNYSPNYRIKFGFTIRHNCRIAKGRNFATRSPSSTSLSVTSALFLPCFALLLLPQSWIWIAVDLVSSSQVTLFPGKKTMGRNVIWVTPNFRPIKSHLILVTPTARPPIHPLYWQLLLLCDEEWRHRTQTEMEQRLLRSFFWDFP